MTVTTTTQMKKVKCEACLVAVRCSTPPPTSTNFSFNSEAMHALALDAFMIYAARTSMVLQQKGVNEMHAVLL